MPRIKFNYFDAFERIAEHACKEAELLKVILKDYSFDSLPEWVTKVHEIENLADAENHQIYHTLADEFVPPIEREDIISLSQHLDDIVDYVDDVVQQLYMFNIKEIYPPAHKMADLIEHACTALYTALKDFRNFKKSKTLDQLIISVSDYEDDADKIYYNSVHELFVDYADDPVFIMSWYHILVRMERCVDAVESAADTVETIIMKNT